MTFDNKETSDQLVTSLGLDKKQETELLSRFNSSIVSKTSFSGEIIFSSEDGEKTSSIDFQKLYDAIDTNNFGSKGANNNIMVDNVLYSISRGGILAKIIQHKILCESNAIVNMSEEEIKKFCDGKIGKLSLLERQKSIDVTKIKNAIKGDLTTMGVVKKPNLSEFSYELGESSWNVDEAKKFAQAILQGDPSGLLEKDLLGEKGDQIFYIRFSVDMKPVVKESTKKIIEKEFLIYQQLAKLILPQSNASTLNALTTEWKGGYDSIYNAKLGFNRAMNAIVSTYLIGRKQKAKISIDLEHANSLESLIAIFKNAKKNNTLPKYSFNFMDYRAGQNNGTDKRSARTDYAGQYIGEETTRKGKVYKFKNVKTSMWYYTFDPRTNGGGSGQCVHESGSIVATGKYKSIDESKYRDGTNRKFDANGNYIH